MGYFRPSGLTMPMRPIVNLTAAADLKSKNRILRERDGCECYLLPGPKFALALIEFLCKRQKTPRVDAGVV